MMLGLYSRIIMVAADSQSAKAHGPRPSTNTVQQCKWKMENGVETTNNSIFIIHNHLDKDDEDCSIFVMDKWMIFISYNLIS
jgi:hypothetical protein